MTLLSAVLGTPNEAARNADTLVLLNYGFAAFRVVKPVLVGTVLVRLPVRDQPGKRAVVITAQAFTRVVARDARVTTRLVLPRQLTGPLRAHAVVGSVLVLVGGRTVARIPLLLARSLAGVAPLTLAARFITRPLSLLALALLLAAPLAVTITWRRRARTRRGRTPPPTSWPEVESAESSPVGRVGEPVEQARGRLARRLRASGDNPK
jgi:D-alanyl-D-alanine carboxypeptidase (penicillin-binding protein 5/6)